MGTTVHPSSLTSRGSAAVLRACASSSSVRINPACVAKPATAAVASLPQRPESFPVVNPPAKRARGACGGKVEPDAATKTKRCPRLSSSSDQDRCPADSLRDGAVEALCVTMNQASASPTPLLPEVASAPQPKPPACSMRELLEKARLAKARSAVPAADDAEAVVYRREIERRRAEARREIEQVVQTVEFNDPFIDPLDVLK